MAHPGTLPVANQKAIENVIKVGLAIGGEIADFQNLTVKIIFIRIFRKAIKFLNNKYPIVSGGHLADFDVTRVHLEEDTANNNTERQIPPKLGLGKFPKPSFGEGYSLIDFNRAGVPLMNW